MNPIHMRRSQNDLILGKNAYMSMDSKRTGRNCNLAVLGSTDAQFRALASENIRQGLCNYVVSTTSEEEFNAASALLVEQGYHICAYDMTDSEKGSREAPLSLLTRSVATAVFLLFDPCDPDSCKRSCAMLSDTISGLYQLRSQYSSTFQPPHIQFFLDGFSHLPPIRQFSQFLSFCKNFRIGVAFSCPDSEALRSIYLSETEEILDCCDSWLLYGVANPRRTLLTRLYSLFYPSECQLQAVGDRPRPIIPIERSGSS